MKYTGKDKYNKNGDVNNPDYNLASLRKYIFDKIDVKGKKVLDVGCGNGRLYTLCKDVGMYVGIDIECQWNFPYNFPCMFFIKNIFELNYFGYDYIFFLGSFYQHFEYGYQATIKKQHHFLKKMVQ
jgi:hypothetical protein